MRLVYQLFISGGLLASRWAQHAPVFKDCYFHDKVMTWWILYAQQTPLTELAFGSSAVRHTCLSFSRLKNLPPLVFLNVLIIGVVLSVRQSDFLMPFKHKNVVWFC